MLPISPQGFIVIMLVSAKNRHTNAMNTKLSESLRTPVLIYVVCDGRFTLVLVKRSELSCGNILNRAIQLNHAMTKPYYTVTEAKSQINIM